MLAVDKISIILNKHIVLPNNYVNYGDISLWITLIIVLCDVI